jgi:3-hydroxybutyryl-CoA dehydrogenase
MSDFKTAVVVGGGTMGGGIAHAMAAAGISVHLVERDEECARQSMDRISRLLDREIAKWGITESEKRAILSRIRASTEVDPGSPADVVLEAIHEDLAAKQALWIRLEERLGRAVLKITHTGTLSVSEIASRLADPSRMIGMHFLPPAHRVPLVEIVRGLKTSEDTYKSTRDLALALRKTPVDVTEYPGYLTVRIIVPMLNEAMHALMEGVASATDIDTAMKLGFDLELGPLALADRIGLDQVLKWMTCLFAELGEPRYRPCPLLRKLVRAGHLGVKTGRGFHEYPPE